MLKRHEHYRDSTVDHEALFVQRNTPRWIKALTKFGFNQTNRNLIMPHRFMPHRYMAFTGQNGAQPRHEFFLAK